MGKTRQGWKEVGLATVPMPIVEDFGTRKLNGPADLISALTDSVATDAITTPPSDPSEIELEAPIAPSPEDPVWQSSLFRLGIAPDGLARSEAYERLSAAMHHFMTQRLELVDLEALRAAVGVLLRVRGWSKTNPYSIRTPYHLDNIANAFVAWHHFRELARAVDVRHDLAARMRNRSDNLILRGLFTGEGREILAGHVEGFVRACERLGLSTASLRRSLWIAKILTYQTATGEWQASPERCLHLCTDLVRELGDEATTGALRDAVLPSWSGLSLETNLLRDVYRKSDDDRVALIAEIDQRFAALVEPTTSDVAYFPGQLGTGGRSSGELAKARRFVF